MKKHEKRLYLENAMSQQFMLLYIVGNVGFTIFTVNNRNVDYQLGIFILLNIFLTLLAFLTAVRQKTYAIEWSYVGFALAVFQFVRLLWIPEEIVNPMRFFLILLLIVTGGLAAMASILCIRRSRERQNFIIENKIDIATLQQ